MQTHPRTHSKRAERDYGCCILYNMERRGFLRGHEGICLGSQKLCGRKCPPRNPTVLTTNDDILHHDVLPGTSSCAGAVGIAPTHRLCPH